MGEIYLLTGGIQSGKTSLCLELIELARQGGERLGGVISPAVFAEGRKIAIDLLDLKSGKRVRLADELDQGETEISTQRWAFKPDAVAWGNQILRETVPCDLLVIDELGPLEFNREEGWIKAFDVLESGDYRSALVVIRPTLLDDALERWDVERIINVDDPDDAYRDSEALFALLSEEKAKIK